MHLQRGLPRETLTATRTLERFLARMDTHMRLQAGIGEEGLLAERALVQFSSDVHFYVQRKTTLLAETLVAEAANERFLAGVDADVGRVVSLPVERFAAVLALERLLAGVDAEMREQVRLQRERSVAVVAAVFAAGVRSTMHVEAALLGVRFAANFALVQFVPASGQVRVYLRREEVCKCECDLIRWIAGGRGRRWKRARIHE